MLYFLSTQKVNEIILVMGTSLLMVFVIFNDKIIPRFI